MSQGDTPLTIVGNLTDDPSLRYTASGAAVASFRVASTPRVFDKTTNDWVDGEGLFLTCNVWRDQAEHVDESLSKGMRVHDIRASLNLATVRVERSRGGSCGSPQGTPPQSAYGANSNPYGNTGGGDPFGAPF